MKNIIDNIKAIHKNKVQISVKILISQSNQNIKSNHQKIKNIDGIR